MNILRAIFGLVLLAFATLASPANAACAGGTCYAAATGNWGTNGTWSIVQGSTVSCVCTPATGDAIVLDATPGNITVTMEAAYSIASLDATGFTGTLTQNAFTMTVTGNTFKLVTGMVYTPSANTRLITFTSTSGTTAITTAAKTLGAVTFNGAGGTFQIQDALNYRSDGVFTLTSGTFDANNFNVTGGSVTIGGAATRVLTMGSGTWSVTGVAGSCWDGTGTLLTVNANTSTLTCSTGSGNRVVALGTSKTYNIVSLGNGGSTVGSLDFQCTTACTIGTLNISGPLYIRFNSTVTYTITNALTIAGTSTNSVGMVAMSTVPTLAIASGSTCNWCAIGGIAFSGSTFTATNSLSLGANTNATITAPSGGGGGKIIGGWLFDNDNTPQYLAKVG